LARRISIFYFALFGALGVFWPYFSLFLKARGMSPTAATRVIALFPVATIIAPPLAGLMADVWRARGWLVRAATALAAVAFVLFFLARRDIVLIGVATALLALFRAPLASMTDAQTLDTVRKHGGSYGRIRLWGSLGFLLAALLGGELLERSGIDTVMIATVGGMVVAALAAWLLPAAHPHAEPRAWPAWRALLAQRDLWWFLLAVALGQLAGATYDSCFSLHLAGLGLGGRFTGAAWAVGVTAEILLMAMTPRILARIGAERMFTLALAGGVVRWGGLALFHSPMAILALQPLHGVTFGFYWVGGVTVLRDRASPEASTAAQGLFGSAYSIGSLCGMLAGGSVLEHHGPGVLFGGAAVAAALAVVASSAHARLAATAPVAPAETR
jgi:MFS transporter, PPP family, 3-phenylpropionic acid transporter